MVEALTTAAQRHRTALRRLDLSRPASAVLRDGLLVRGRSFFDYGCGHGDDVRRLERQGYECAAWDPVYRPDAPKRASDVVNLGYVVNVIEDPCERSDTLRDAWSYARRLLVVAARLENEARPDAHDSFADGVMTSRGTFQKFYDQRELREWIGATLGEQCVAAAPGIFYVFRSAQERESFVASRFRVRERAPRVRRSDEIYEAHREVLEPLRQFLSDRGRLPDAAELELVPEIEDRVGSLRRALGVIERVTGLEEWRDVRKRRAQELLIYLALVRFHGRPKASELPLDLRLDVKAFFGAYKRACAEADALLFSAGDPSAIDAACRRSSIGKCTPPALYVHACGLSRLDPVLRVYEGCARAYVGAVDDANVIKLHREEPKVSYLAYPDFDADPHPALSYSLAVHLQTFRLRETDYAKRENPPILHRKEEFVPSDHPLREKFARLTRQEERYGLFDDAHRIGLRHGWESRLAERGVRLQGHRLVRRRPGQEEEAHGAEDRSPAAPGLQRRPEPSPPGDAA